MQKTTIIWNGETREYGEFDIPPFLALANKRGIFSDEQLERDAIRYFKEHPEFLEEPEFLPRVTKTTKPFAPRSRVLHVEDDIFKVGDVVNVVNAGCSLIVARVSEGKIGVKFIGKPKETRAGAELFIVANASSE